MQFNDRLGINSKRTYTDEGFMIVPANIARTGIQEYRAIELGLTDRDPMDIIKIYRPPEEVFKQESLDSFANKPVTDNHPKDLVDATNHKDLSVGHSGQEVIEDGIFAKTILHINDAKAIKKIEDGKVELSNGYTSDIEWTSGITPEGETYDAIQRNIVGNHIAIVDRGRCGAACRVSDNSPENKDEAIMAKITIDGVDYEASEQVAQAVGILQTKLSDAEEKASNAMTEKEKAELDAEEAEKKAKKTEDTMQAKVDDAMSKVPGPEMLDQLVNNRMNTRDAALKIDPNFTFDGKDCEQIRKDIVAKACPEVNLDTASVDYIRARFDALVDSGSNTSVLDNAMKKQIEDKDDNQDDQPDSAAAREKFMADSRNAWKGNK